MIEHLFSIVINSSCSFVQTILDGLGQRPRGEPQRQDACCMHGALLSGVCQMIHRLVKSTLTKVISRTWPARWKKQQSWDRADDFWKILSWVTFQLRTEDWQGVATLKVDRTSMQDLEQRMSRHLGYRMQSCGIWRSRIMEPWAVETECPGNMWGTMCGSIALHHRQPGGWEKVWRWGTIVVAWAIRGGSVHFCSKQWFTTCLLCAGHRRPTAKAGSCPGGASGLKQRHLV